MPESVRRWLAWIWTCFKTNFGGKFTHKLDINYETNKTMMVACLVTGTVVWIAMRSQLIALLSVEKTVYPIDGFESLLGSKFTLVNFSVGKKIFGASLYFQPRNRTDWHSNGWQFSGFQRGFAA